MTIPADSSELCVVIIMQCFWITWLRFWLLRH